MHSRAARATKHGLDLFEEFPKKTDAWQDGGVPLGLPLGQLLVSRLTGNQVLRVGRNGVGRIDVEKSSYHQLSQNATTRASRLCTTATNSAAL